MRKACKSAVSKRLHSLNIAHVYMEKEEFEHYYKSRQSPIPTLYGAGILERGICPALSTPTTLRWKTSTFVSGMKKHLRATNPSFGLRADRVERQLCSGHLHFTKICWII